MGFGSFDTKTTPKTFYIDLTSREPPYCSCEFPGILGIPRDPWESGGVGMNGPSPKVNMVGFDAKTNSKTHYINLLGCPGTHHNESKANIGLLRTPGDPCRRSMEVYGSLGDFPGDPGDSRQSLQWALAQSRYSGSDSTNNLKPHCIDFDPGCISQVRMGLGSKSIKWGLRLDLVSDPTVSTFGQF